jgi:hypothetical protein
MKDRVKGSEKADPNQPGTVQGGWSREADESTSYVEKQQGLLNVMKLES